MFVIKLSFLSFVVFMVVLGARPLHAETRSDFQLDQTQVLDLMRQETEKLLGPPVVHNSSTKSAIKTESLYLKALYGVGKRVLAEVHWNGHEYLYLKGQAWPLGHTKQKTLRLVKMADRCITLAQEEQSHHLCVNVSGAE